jgi:hypothetical protein
VLAADGRLRLARVAARELGVQMPDRLAQHFGDRRALARRERRPGYRAQLPDERLERLADGCERQPVGPFRRGIGVGECERRRVERRARGGRQQGRGDGGGNRHAGLGSHGAFPPPPARSGRPSRIAKRDVAAIAKL